MTVHNGPTESILSSTTNMLNSLVSFYQQERMWVYRMRAMLQEPQLDEGPDQVQSEAIPDFSMGSQDYQILDEPNTSTVQTRWMLRKREFKLRLEGIRLKRFNPLPNVQQQPVEQLRPREQMLEMFEKMMEARMESCQRVKGLVLEASRVNSDGHDDQASFLEPGFLCRRLKLTISSCNVPSREGAKRVVHLVLLILSSSRN